MITTSLINTNTVAKRDSTFIRFQERKERYNWVSPDEICFVKSADHYVKSLIKHGTEYRWMSRHCTLKELLYMLPADHFIRLNKFYLLNCKHFSCFNENDKMLYLNDNFPIPIPHRISPYVRNMLKK